MIVKYKNVVGSLSFGRTYQVITISISNVFETGVYVINDLKALGYYRIEHFEIVDESFGDGDWGMFCDNMSVIISPKAFLKVDDFLLRLSDFDNEAVNLFKEIFPNLHIDA
jgi:hypothetical protein